jgi:CheY-like chemotaxis protein
MSQAALRTADRSYPTDPLEARNAAPKILIVDDDPFVVKSLADRCMAKGFNVATATNGAQALLQVSRFRPDLLIVDAIIPGVDALFVYVNVLAYAHRPPNVIVITESQDLETERRREGPRGAYYARKDATFWHGIEEALTDIFPERAIDFPQSGVGATALQIRERPHVLLVDDDADFGRLLVSHLENCGMDALYAANGHMAYRAACHERPTVIVSDYAMPKGDANYLLTRLRTRPSTADIPFIVLTGRKLAGSEQQNLTRAIRGHPGAAGIVRKSPDIAELLGTLKRFCGFEYDYR